MPNDELRDLSAGYGSVIRISAFENSAFPREAGGPRGGAFYAMPSRWRTARPVVPPPPFF
jgi:hypothetical protein